MLMWILGFLVLALVAGILGLGGAALQGTLLARLSFVFFLLGFLISAVPGIWRRRRVPPRP